MIKNDSMTGMSAHLKQACKRTMQNSDDNCLCPECAINKSKRQPYKNKKETKSKQPATCRGEKIHADF